MKPRRRTRWSRAAWLAVFITLLGALLRFYRLDAQSFWGDEALSSLIAARGTSEIWNNTLGSANPEGYYLLLHTWRSLAGDTDLALRCLSALLGVLSIALTYQLGRTVRSKRLGLWAAGITTVTPYHLYYSQETRMYTLLYCLACIMILVYIRLWRGHRRRYWCIAYVLAAVAGLWTHFFAGLVIGTLVIHFCMLRLWPRSQSYASPLGWPSFVAVNSGVALAFLLYMPHVVQRLVIHEGWRPVPSPANLVSLPLALTASQFVSGAWQVTAFGCVMFLLIIVVLQVTRAMWQRDPASEWLLLLGLLPVVPVMTSFSISQFWKPVFSARVLIVVVPALYLLLAWSAVHTRERRFNQFVLVLLLPQMALGLHNWFFDPSYAKPPTREAVRVVQEHELADALVLHAIPESYMVFEHYAPTLDNRILIDPVQPRGAKRIDPPAVSHRRFWFVVLPTYRYESQLAWRDNLDARFVRRQESNVGGVQLYRYVPDES